MSDYVSGVFLFKELSFNPFKYEKIPSSFLQVCHSKSGEVNSTTKWQIWLKPM